MPWTAGVSHMSEFADYWTRQALESSTFVKDVGASSFGCNKITTSFTRGTPVGTREDTAQVTLHLAKVVGGGLYTPLTIASEFAAVETILNTMWTSYMALMNDNILQSDYRWHEVRAEKYKIVKEQYVDVLGPAVRLTTSARGGGVNGSRMPDQVAVTCTLRTAGRKHWGRIYLPGLARTQYESSFGRVANPGAIGSPLRTAINSLSTAGYELGVWSPRGRAFLTITRLDVDNVPDVIRRRRPKQASARSTFTS